MSTKIKNAASSFTNIAMFKSLQDDIQFDKYKYLLFYLGIIYAAYSVSLVFSSIAGDKRETSKLYNNIIMIFFSFGLLFFFSDAENLFKGKGYQILIFTVMIMIMHPFISKETKDAGYDWISIKEFFFGKPISFAYIFIFGFLIVFNILLSGINFKIIGLLMSIILYLLSGYFLDKKVSMWFLSLLPLMTISLEMRKSIIFVLLYPVLLSYIIHSGSIVNFELYKE